MEELTLSPPATESVTSAPRDVLDEPLNNEVQLPPRGGLPLGAILGVAISLLVAVLLGGLTAVQLHREERRELAARQELLAESLAPLAEEIERSSSLVEISQHLSSSVRAEIARGHSDFNLVLRGGDGREVGSALTGAGTSPPPDSLQVQIPVRSALLTSGHGSLTVWQDASGFAAEMASRRLAAWLDIGATVLAIIIVVQLTIYLLVSRPLDRLLTAIEKVELGYPAKLRRGDIARELRWLAWRFHRMSSSLTNSARLLVAAHRRAMEVSKSRLSSNIDPRFFDPLDLDRSGHSEDHDIFRRYLRSRCAVLEGYRPGDPRAREVALQVWERDAVEAEIFGEMDLRARAENAALKILDPRAFDNTSRELNALIGARAEWCVATVENMKSGLVADDVPVVAIQHRAKHAAGAWRKMQEKGLGLDDVNDLIAFRVIVPSQDDCYLALETVHRLFEPEPFRFKDYITSPKANGYQSLHTSLRDRNGFAFEVQIRTVEMHRAAEEGGAAHWRYRAGTSVRLES
jgi:HAMP domain-containing protein